MQKDTSVLILDDEKNILSSLQRLLEEEPFAVATTTDTTEAMQIIANEDIKVVLSDERMPEISGTEFLWQVKKTHPDIIRILFTGYADLGTVTKSINVNEIFRFVNKPWEDKELKKIIRLAIKYFDSRLYAKNLLHLSLTENNDLKGLNKKLESMYNAQKEFHDNTSHAIRTSLASAKAAVDIMLSGTTGTFSKTQEDFLNKAKTSIERVDYSVTDILTLSRLEYEYQSVGLQKNHINTIIQDVVGVQGLIAEEKGLYLRKSLDPDIPKCFFDADKIRLLLDNLIHNAVKFTKKGGITVSSVLHRENNNIKVFVTDSGCGIPKNAVSKLFQKFQQLNHTSKEGTGLGLAI